MDPPSASLVLPLSAEHIRPDPHRKDQTPPDLVVKSQLVDIADPIL
jgi:hypothetical protein